MKKGTIVGITAAVVLIAVMGALALYLTFQYKDDAFSSTQSKTESEADAVLLALHEPGTENASSETGPSAEIPLIWAGDSRTLGMRDALDNDDIYIGASGEGYDWLSESGLPKLKQAIKNNPNSPVIFNFGVNDYDNLDNYITLYQSLTKEYSDTTFYFLSVNPIEPTICKNITNEEITDFNQHLKAAFPETFLDSFTYLMINEVIPFDGVHYSEEDYQKIYDFTVNQIS